MAITNLHEYNKDNHLDRIETNIGRYRDCAKALPGIESVKDKYPRWHTDSKGCLQADITYQDMKFAVTSYGDNSFALLYLSNHFLPNSCVPCEPGEAHTFKSGDRLYRDVTTEDRNSGLFAGARLEALGDDLGELLAYADLQLTAWKKDISGCQADDREDALEAARARGDFDI